MIWKKFLDELPTTQRQNIILELNNANIALHNQNVVLRDTVKQQAERIEELELATRQYFEKEPK